MLVAIAYNVLVLSCVESKIKKKLFSIKKKNPEQNSNGDFSLIPCVGLSLNYVLIYFR